MWDAIKQEILKKMSEELQCQGNWDILKKCVADDALDEYLILPLLTKLNIHLKKYLMIFTGIHILIISLIILNIFICLYRR